MKTIVPSVKGTRDFYPEDMAIRVWMYNTMRQVSEAFGYQEYEAPILETLNLYAAKSGEELVNQQSYVFSDRGGDLITLRPEMTPSLARIIAQRQNQLVYPLRWWSFGPFWRYEKPQKGRTREHFQWNIDLIGVNTAEADAEMIAIAANFFKQVGLSSQEVAILVNDRQLTGNELAALGLPPEKHTEALTLIDRRPKMEPAEWDAYALEIGLSKGQLDGLKSVLADQNLWKKSERLVRIFDVLEAMGGKEYVRYDSNIIRGLLYYTSTVFEAFDLSGEIRRSILGGGRYDNLLAAVGGDPMPAVGFAMGDLIITLILQRLGYIPDDLGRNPADALVTVFAEDLSSASQLLANEIRQAGLRVICSSEAGKLPKQFKFADRMKIRVAIVLGPDEKANGQVTIKDLASGTQQTVDRAQAAQTVRKVLESPVGS
jgi:histidyl-tRNA synthetase